MAPKREIVDPAYDTLALSESDDDLDSEEITKAHAAYMKRRKAHWREKNDPFISRHNPQARVGAVSEGFEDALEECIGVSRALSDDFWIGKDG